ncbi:MAG: hypothetical protein ALECFALPRED_002226 [Alectoria fallacina]|uniref:Zn(2)-C6 fungal-type domain-containing protein n=1 Tax=Alectoria fallacina TaxID=1903189 RepID=A0A8H3IPM5_9LECA|nr:MAG: hypothetical protein ALECFALPRED_002226 [Alectoria fallacina]
MSASSRIPSVSEEPPHKKLRKGTHSCIECRRRKKSCVPRPATPGSCEECFARGVHCRKQEVSQGWKRRPQHGKHDLQQRVAELETALLSISQKLETTPRTTESGDGTAQALQQLRSEILPSTPVASPDPNPEALLELAPVLSLFDNAILSRHPADSTRSAAQDSNGTRPPKLDANKNPNPKLENIRQALLSLFPSQQRQEAILNVSHTWWASWQGMFAQMYGPGPSSDFRQFVKDSKASGSVQKIAKTLLCLFVVVQEEPVSFSTGYDTESAGVQLSLALSVIDNVVLGDDELAGTLDGVECMFLRGKYDINDGRIRRAWFTNRRAISFAQLLGLHKCQGPSVVDINESLRRESLWKALYVGDRFLSLLLGLPYGSSETHSDVGRDSELSANRVQAQPPGEHYLFRLANVVGHIIDRNQQLPSNNMLPLTFKIEAELMELAASMPDDWWESGLQSGAMANQMHSQLLPQFMHHQARTLLHLPFMLKATTDRRFEYNKMQALESAREMIARYRVIRPVQGFGSLACKVIDFQVFTAAMVLVLNLLDHYRKSDIRDHSEAESDQELISVTTDILQRASIETNGSVATQAARALEIFSNIKGMSSSRGESIGECTMKVVIPCFGAVVIGPGTSFRDHVKAQKPGSTPQPQPQQLPTPSDQSLDGSTPEYAPPSHISIAPLMPFESSSGETTQGIGVNSDVFADFNFDLDQDWSWFWNNIDIPSVELQGMAA